MSTLYLNIYRRLGILFFYFCAVYSSSASQLAEANLNAPNVVNDGVWVLTNPEAPLVVADDKRRLSGHLVDVVNGILATANIKRVILAAPWERVEKEARTKSNVLVFALARTPEREDNYHWITPLTANVISVFSLDGEKDQFKSLKDLESLGSIAVLDKDVRHRILLAASYPEIHTFPSWHDAIDAVNSGKSDAIFFSGPGIKHFCFAEGKRLQSARSRVYVSKNIQLFNTF